MGGPSPRASDDATRRVASLDVFRGCVILAMVFVNYIGEMPNLSPILKHAKASEDTITLPDLVFPAFLFITGVAIPLSLHKRVARGDPWWSLAARIVPRAALLMLIGVVYEFHGELEPENTGMPVLHWMSLFYLGLFLALNVYPPSDRVSKKRIYDGCQMAGTILIVAMLLVYRGPAKADGGFEWIHHRWWGILGLIGWGYLNASLLYLMVRGREKALLLLFGCLLALYMAGRHTDAMGRINDFVYVPVVLGSISANVMAGVVVGSRFVDASQTGATRLRFMSLFGAAMCVVGFLLRPVHGFSKIGATESYTLVTAGFSCLLLAGFYYALDVRASVPPPRWLAVVGANPLLAYLVPDIWSRLAQLLGVDGLWWKAGWYFHDRGGGAGLVNAALVSLLMMGMTVLLVRLGVRLKV